MLKAEAVGDENNARILIEDSHIDIFSKQGMERMSPGSTLNAGYGSYTIEIEVTDVDEEFTRLKNKDVTLIKLPETYPWGRRSFWFRDPDGNIINFYSNLSKGS
ncbi:VOC family protein [Paenibacillus guangzhouensis]|uniref:VOC family protein n=1 Tax=Paenibacillus guangzhouensis TaxID=1473112 RepID=UPI0022391918|nr:VOC family protein [Paenibacillus guangzhouensis]